MGAGLAGSSSGTAYIESVAGIQVGGRTGLTSVFTALCFLPCFFIAPLAVMVPPFATAAVLILVGAAMFTSIGQIKFSKLEEGVPAFLTLILIPLTFSITQGILWGFISHVGLYLMAGRRRDIHPVMYALALVSIGLGTEMNKPSCSWAGSGAAPSSKPTIVRTHQTQPHAVGPIRWVSGRMVCLRGR